MKKYRFLEAGEIIKSGDQFKHAEDAEWYDCEIAIGSEIFKGDEDYFRRPVPLELENRFLVNLSITVSVEFDCTGLSEDEINEKAAQMACNKVANACSEYVIPENVDWEQSRLDDDEFQPKYRELEIGEKVEPEDFFHHKNGNWVKVIEFPHRVLEEEKGRFKRRV